MSSKTKLGATKAFSSLSSTVKKAGQVQEEPKMTADDVVKTFRSFGFEPNQKNNDVAYWTTQPVSAKDKLIAELKKERDEHNKKVSETLASKKTLSRLSDKEIAAIYDEYGIPKPDPNWVRQHLPNDPEKLRAILEIQHKTMVDALKMQTKNAVKTALPPVQTQPAGQPIQQAQPMGMGGPGLSSLAPSMSTGGSTGMNDPENPASPFFIGDNAIVKIANPNNPNSHTLWLLDSKKKTLRPFMSDQAFENAFHDPNQARQQITTISTHDLAPGGALSGFKMLNSQYGVQDDGSMKDVEFSPAQVADKYGKPSDPNAENKALQMVDGLLHNSMNSADSNPGQQLNTDTGMGGPGFDGQGGPDWGVTTRDPNLEQSSSTMVNGLLQGAEQFGKQEISPDFLNDIKSDVEQMGFYVSALAYGGYTMGDIYNDIKRKELISQGNSMAENMPPIISSELPRSKYINTADGKSATAQASSMFPGGSKMLNVDPDIFKYSVFNIPDEAFKKLVPIYDVNSQEFKDAADQVKAAFYDVAVQQLGADTSEKKAVADYNYKQLQDQIQKTYGFTISNNADAAWKQLESLGDNFSQRNLGGSGLQNEAVDDYLKTFRKQNDALRYNKLNTEEQTKANYYRTSATPEEIKALSGSDLEKWGLTPSADIASQYSLENIMKAHPEMTQEEAQRVHDSVLDENGNYRSSLYQTQQTNVADTLSQKRIAQANQVMNNSMNAEEKAYRTYTNDNNFLFSNQGDAGTKNVGGAIVEPEIHTNDKPIYDPNIKIGGAFTRNGIISNDGTNPITQPTQKPTVPNYNPLQATKLAGTNPANGGVTMDYKFSPQEKANGVTAMGQKISPVGNYNPINVDKSQADSFAAAYRKATGTGGPGRKRSK